MDAKRSRDDLRRRAERLKLVGNPIRLGGLVRTGVVEQFPFETLQTIHKNKTGALITSAVQAGAIGSGASTNKIENLIIYGNKIGLSFQIVDDLLNATSTTHQLGKAAGSDSDRGKATYPAYFGIDETRNQAFQAVENAKAALENFDHKADPLRALADYIYTRSN